MARLDVNVNSAKTIQITQVNGVSVDEIHFADDDCKNSCIGTTVNALYADNIDVEIATVLCNSTDINDTASLGYYCFSDTSGNNTIYYWDGKTLTKQTC